MSYISRSNRFRKRKKINFKKVGTLLTLVVFVVMVFACIRYFTLFNTLRGSDSPTIWRPDNNDRVQLLLVGKLDTVVSCSLLSIPADKDQAVYVLRIPPQVLLSGPEQETMTLADSFSQSGIEDGITRVNQLLVNKFPIHHYVVYDVAGVNEIIHAVDGVSIELPAGFQIRHGDTDYVFAPGENTISSDNLLPLLASDSALEATNFWAEKTLLVELFNELFSLNHISYLVTNLKAVSDVYETDMSSRELARFRDTFQALEWESLNFVTLPGRWLTAEGEKYWSTETKLVNLTIQQILEGMAPYNRDALIVDVYNGNGVNGFAARTATRLRELDFQIGRVSNAPDLETTAIYYHTDYKLAAMEISLFLEVEAVLIEQPYNDSENPVAVILGRDLIGGSE